MQKILMLFLSLFDRWRQSRFLEKYATSAGMAEGGGNMVREQLTSYENDEDQIVQLRQEFKIRYHSFKTLLQANNNALENMASMERALQDCSPFPFSFIKEKAISVSVNVFRMIRSLNEIIPHKYQRLYEVFQHLEKEIGSHLNLDKTIDTTKLVLPIDQCDQSISNLIGNKMTRLGELKNQAGFKTPGGFVVTSDAYFLLLNENRLDIHIAKLLQVVDFDSIEAVEKASQEIQLLIKKATIPSLLKHSIESALTDFLKTNPNNSFALRSSATGEDTVRSSSAGQYLSKLNIHQESMFTAYKEVLASKYTTKAMIYRYNLGLIDEQVSMAVGFIPMVDSAVGGVMYTCNPLDCSDNNIFINSCWGLPKAVVEGDSTCDHFIVSALPAHEILHREIQNKEYQYVNRNGEGVERIGLKDNMVSSASLSDNQVKQLAQIAIKLDVYFGAPQDIEWCIDKKDQIKILQCRPLTSLNASPDPSEIKPKIEAPKRLMFNEGITVNPGRVTGETYWVETQNDFKKFPKGAILCIKNALPRWAPILSRAAGVIAEEGSFAGHLATVAREFKIPCLFGVKGIKDRLINGTSITLNANNREIYLGYMDISSEQNGIKDNLIKSSPIYQKLYEISRLITPLNLIDPNSADFRPSGCKTLHDITRFIHEKSVIEMFDFGRNHHFSERSAKQLYYKVPMQWWVLNLDDGYIKETSNRYVRLENIASLPMLALWKGMISMPWEGPPPIDGRGFLSVMFQATTNHSLITSSKGGFADKNYFMISKNFCNLSSRLGFHFTIIESIVSEENPEENYISFKFKGGAADIKRRTSRINFLGELLENYGFSTKARSDTLVAKLESPDSDYVKMRLVILGYLLIHTRQIDMIMQNSAAVSYYRSKFEKDIATILNSETALA